MENPLCEILGDRIVKYADDNTTLSTTEDEAELAGEIIRTHYEYWGGSINDAKTERLRINYGPVTPEPISILGARVGAGGVELRVEPGMFERDVSWLAMLTAKGYGLTALQTLTLGYARVWAKTAYSLPLALPPLRLITFAWLRLCRRCLNTYPTAHSLKVIEAIGVLRTPFWWGLKAAITFYTSALKEDYTHRALAAYEGTEEIISRRVTEYLRPCGLTWSDLRDSSDTTNLIHRARVHFIAWIRVEMNKESDRIGIGSTTFRLHTAKYLREREGRYGFPFLQPHLGPANRLPDKCYFCTAPSMDTGHHLIFECPGIPFRPDIPRSAWLLTDEAHPRDIRAALDWMGEAWRERTKRWKNEGKIVSATAPRKPASKFLQPPSDPRRGSARQDIPRRADRIRGERPPEQPDLISEPPPRRLRTVSPSPPVNRIRIIRRRTENGPVGGTEHAITPQIAGNRRRRMPDDAPEEEPPARRRRVSNSEDDTAIVLPQDPPSTPEQTEPAPVTLRKGRWTREEDERLLAAIDAGGDIHSYARAVGTRDVRQVTSRMRTDAFRRLAPPSETAAPPTRARAKRWCEDELALLMRAMNEVGSVHEYDRIQILLPHRTVASITKKVNTLLSDGRLVKREDRFVILP